MTDMTRPPGDHTPTAPDARGESALGTGHGTHQGTDADRATAPGTGTPGPAAPHGAGDGTTAPGTEAPRGDTLGTAAPGTATTRGEAHGAGATGTGHTDTGHTGAGHTGAGHTDTGHTGTGHTGAGHTGTEHTGTGHTGAGHTGTEHTGTGHTGTGHTGTGHIGADHTGADGTPGHRTGAEARDRLFPHDDSDKLGARLQHAVAGFVDGPRASVEEADHVLEEIAARFTEAVAERRRTLRHSWQSVEGGGEGRSVSSADTEQLRLALKDYRELAERLLHV
ncbi:hypothetical protein [Streptomyces sp. NPDC029554]|uniref:hypothetical protein n=1 Tax=Streptomyces sp. NPDC029554 TaxID=3155126 RepID=UPI0033F022F6